MRKLDRIFGLFGAVSGVLSCLYYTVIQRQDWKILHCVQTAPGFCDASSFVKLMSDLTWLTCPAQILQIVEEGSFSYAMWVVVIAVNAVIFTFVGRAFQMALRRLRPGH